MDHIRHIVRPVSPADRGDAPDLPHDMMILVSTAVVHRESHGTVRKIGYVERGSGLWRDSVMTLLTPAGPTKIAGTSAWVPALTTDCDADVVLPLHDGYLGVFGTDGQVAGRILRIGSELHARAMSPHATGRFEKIEAALSFIQTVLAGK